MFVSHGDTVHASTILMECLLECLSSLVSALQGARFEPSVFLKIPLQDRPRLSISIYSRGGDSKSKSIRTIHCTERRCCRSTLLGYWAQSWTCRHSAAVYWNGSIIPASWYRFCRPRKDDRQSQPHLVSIQQPSGI